MAHIDEPCAKDRWKDTSMVSSLAAVRERVVEARARAEQHQDNELLKLLDDALQALSDEALLTTTEVAQLLGIRSVNTIKAFIRAGRIDAQKVGSHYRISLREVERLSRDSTIQGLHASNRFHSDLDAMGLGAELTSEELQAL